MQASVSEAIEGRLIEDGCEVSKEQFQGETVTFGYTSEFRWLSRVHVLVAVANRQTVTEADVRDFTIEVLRAADGMGLRRGLQSGVLVMPVLVASGIVGEIPAMMDRPYRLGIAGFAALAQPAAVDADTGQVFTYRGGRVMGYVYAKLIRDKVQTYLTDLASPSLP
ncbi:hypothetical protein GA0074692_0732 [Micromonospora pallida]|uniref:Uncharacterized protein n=1 Tax=Micromonospora pallida TaxID=145854 RepID=A0A1C6RRR2_9ACTN|nr:hypothetical protein [Micromonospora pallida]SCL19902.1 hypothetical protein GA0074692_0732 [Micromonospora pallida]